MRLIAIVLLALVPILGVYTFVYADEWGLWFPPNVSTYGGDIDRLFDIILWMVGITFVLTEVILVWCVMRYPADTPGKATFTHGSHKLEMFWTAVPAVLLLVIAFSQMKAWAAIKFEKNFPTDSPYTVEQPFAEVIAYQFAWLVRYPGPDGSFASNDAVESPFEFVVPEDTSIVFRLESRDVLHSFFVPNFRLKQDAVPGMSIPMWFNAQESGEYDLICAELCGWGHYKMAGKVVVKPKAEFESWLAEKRAALYANH